jgi:hypothetical protein
MIRLRRLIPELDAELVHTWVTQPYARFWGLGSADVAAIRASYRAIEADPGRSAYLGLCDEQPAFLVELYEPAEHSVGAHYEVRRGDVGMHFLVAPPSNGPVHGFTRRVLRAVLAHCFADPEVQRVVVEPDVANDKVQALNADVGFVAVREIELPYKRALLSLCTRADFEAAFVGVNQ